MSRIKFKIEAHCELDTDNYPEPADGRLTLQLKEDIQDVLESGIDIQVNVIKIIKGAVTNDEETQNND